MSNPLNLPDQVDMPEPREDAPVPYQSLGPMPSDPPPVNPPQPPPPDEEEDEDE